MDLRRYADLFLTESREHLSALNHQLLELERAPGASEPVQAIFRAVHTVKGMSATMGYRAVTELAHELESVLDRVRRAEQPVTRPVMDVFFAAADALEAAIERAVQGEPGAEGADDAAVTAVVDRLKALATLEGAGRASGERGRGTGRHPRKKRRSAAGADGVGRLVRVRLAQGVTLRGARAFLVVKRAEALGTVSAIMPPLDALQAEEFDRDFALRIETTASAEKIVEALRAVGDVEAVDVEPESRAPRPRAAATASVAAPGAAPVAASGTANEAPASAAPALGDRSAERGAATRAPRHVRIDLRRLDTLMNLVGELVIARGRLAQLTAPVGDPAIEDVVAQTSRLIGELQHEIMLSRMVPVGQVFDRFPRLVRDAARALGKEITFAAEGNDIELDRSMLDEIGEPVVHLLRNAVDHGIEMPDVRVAAGKPAVGTLTLSVARERSTFTLRVSDDGRGIDRSRVIDRAREMGLLEGPRTELSDDELVRIIARPGFSTAERVTDLSGRGVGIDVVMNRVRAMGGAVEIRSTPGRGTTVTVRLPLTLAIVRALLARVDEEVYAVPMAHVNETVELEARALRRVQGREVLVVREDILPLIRFRDLVHLPTAEPVGPRGAGHQVIVLEVGDRRAGLVVDELTGQQDIVVKQFDPARNAVAMFSGATILADGAPALIVDVGSLL